MSISFIFGFREGLEKDMDKSMWDKNIQFVGQDRVIWRISKVIWF